MTAKNIVPFVPHVTPEVQGRMALAQLEALRMARDATVNMIDKIDRAAAGLLEAREDHPMSGTTDLCLAFTRVTRTLRQIIVLEQEVAGLREPPRRYYAAASAPAAANDAASRDSEDRAERDDDRERDDLRDPPDRDDTHDDDDYDDREFDIVLASVRKTLDRVARDLPFEERARFMAQSDVLEAQMRGEKPRSGNASSSDAAGGLAAAPGKGPRSPPDTG
jgi:hypothetical protein